MPAHDGSEKSERLEEAAVLTLFSPPLMRVENIFQESPVGGEIGGFRGEMFLGPLRSEKKDGIIEGSVPV